MNGVIGMTGLLLESDLSSPQREYTETIQSSAEALLTIINDILDFSKIEAGLMRFEKIDFELRGAVEAPVDLLAERAQAKGLELASLVYRDVPTALRGDPGRLRQVLTNLIGNAVKFTDSGEVVVSVTKVSETASDAKLRFEVQDTGIGVSAEAQRGLFRAFTQGDGSTTRKYGGTGLGLAISKQLVELMGGRIGIDSTPGHGATFWFTARFDKQMTPATTANENAGNLALARILIVDDSATNRNILNHQASSWGMVATEAESGKKALELLRAGVAQGEPYDIAVLDLTMPDMNGFQLAETIKSDHTIASVALVLLPSFGKRGHGEKASQAGIAAYLQKPVRQSQLHDCLTAVMARSGIETVTEQRLVTRHSMRESEAQQKDKTLSTVRIIIAEDSIVNQKVALGQLYNLGYQAEAVLNGRELLKSLENDHFDIILMDCQMPELDGFAATAEIRRREGTVRHTTIIAMTANALDGDYERCLAAGMDDYLSKPVKSDLLRMKLERWAKPSRPGKRSGEGNAPAQHNRGSVIDQAHVARLRELQPLGEADFLTELIDLFLNEAASHLKDLHDAVMRKDAIGIQQASHSLKGSSANIGATQMAALSEELQSKDAGEILAQLEREFGLVREVLKAERKETGE
jgi:CheY-like chemotaxis protein/HPt (histidine-containing phosphotransfer) domain-containing protein